MGHVPLSKRLTGRKSQLILFSGLAGICLVATVVLATQVFFKLNDYARASKDNVPWSLSRFETDQLKLVNAIYHLNADTPASLDELNRRFDAFYSRKHTLLTAEGYRDLFQNPDAQAAMTDIADKTIELSTIIDGEVPQLIASRERMIGLTEAMTPSIQALSKHGIAAYSRLSEADRTSLTSKLVQVTVLNLLLLTALLSLTWLLWQLYRLYRQRALENRSTLNRLSTILNTSQDAVLVVCPDGTIIDTNRASDAMFFGRTITTDRARVENILMRRQEDGGLMPVDGERLMKSCETGPNLCANLLARAPDGGVFPVELSADKATRGGQPVVICFIRNIARRVADQAEILAARDTALSGERAKARFLGMISHEMRTPLNGLLGTLDLLDDTPLTPEQKRYTQIMQSSGELLLDQINDALDITQAEEGVLTLSEQSFDLDELVAHLVQAQTPLAKQHGNRLIAPHNPAPLGPVRGDRNRVHQVLLNLISNAIKFTENGEISIEAVRLTGPGDMVEFQISDTGIGIDSPDQGRIFEDFVRLEDATAQSVEGTGLGLGIVRHLVGLMEGEYGVESEPGEGSLFWVRLPLPRAKADEAPDNATTAKVVPTPIHALDILIVEDNAINRTVLEEMLRKDGHNVWHATNGAEGVTIAGSRRFDVILMDLSMPVLDGFDASRRIREGGGASAKAKIVALTAHFTGERDARLRSAGIDGILNKPLRRTALKSLLSGARAQPNAPVQAKGPVDPQTLEQLRDTLPDARVDALLEGFFAEGAALMTGLSRTGQAAVPADLMAQLHHLAGTAATVGATALLTCLNRAESALKSGNRIESDTALQRLPGVWKNTLDELNILQDAA